MSYLVRVEDKEGRIKSYFKIHDINRARYLYNSISEQCLQRGEVVKLLNEHFHVLQTTLQPIASSRKSAG
jgi:hypothetical protein